MVSRRHQDRRRGRAPLRSWGDLGREPDGTNPTVLGLGAAPDWQPIPINSYARPKSATPFKVSLVPAYTPCTAPNRTHGPPLDSDSCNPPAQASDELTLGTPDANGKPVRATGFGGVRGASPATCGSRWSSKTSTTSRR